LRLVKQEGYRIRSTSFTIRDTLPKIDEVDFLVSDGRADDVNDEADITWLTAKNSFNRQFNRTVNPFLGICLGAQLIASEWAPECTQNEKAIAGGDSGVGKRKMHLH